MNFTGHSGNDTINGTSAHDVFDLSQGGEDAANGRGGNDIFNMGAALDAGDAIDGGNGNDTVVLDGEYSPVFPFRLVFTATTMVNVENLVVAAGHDYDLKTANETVAAGDTLTVDATALNGSHALTFDGQAETDGSFYFIGGAGGDNLTGGFGNDTFDLSLGGNDSANGGGGNDTFLMGGAFNNRDVIAGGGGDDVVILDGDYSQGVVMSPNSLPTIARLVMKAGHSYDLSTGGGPPLVDASALGAGNFLHYDEASETVDAPDTVLGGGGDDRIATGNGGDTIVTGAGKDFVDGGDGDDTIDMGANLTAADRVNGGDGTGDTLLLDGDYTGAHAVVFAPNTVVNVETTSVAAGHSYDLTFDPDNFSNFFIWTFDATALGKTDSLNLVVDPTARIHVDAGRGNDTITGTSLVIDPLGGAPVVDISNGGNDTVVNGISVYAGAAFTAADSITHGRLELEGNYAGAHKLVLGANSLHDVNELLLLGAHSYDITMNDGNLSAGHNLLVGANGTRLVFDGSAETDGTFHVSDTAGNDVIAGGAQGDTFVVFAGGDDTVRGIGGNDVFNVSTAALAGNYLFDGGAGRDTLTFQPDDVSTTFTGNLKNMEAITVGFTWHFDFITVDANVGAGKTMTVDGSALTGGGTLGFNGSAETNGSFIVVGGLNNEALTTGAGNDTLQGGLGGDSLTGGAGNDIFRYNSVAESTSSTHDADMDFDPAHDKFDLNVHVKGIDPAINGQLFISQSFDSQLETQVSGLVPHHAVLFTAGAGGDISGTFLIVDANGTTGYQASEDYVIQVALSTLTKSLFI